MKKYILFLFSSMLIAGAFAMDTAATYTVGAQFANKTEKPKYTIDIVDVAGQHLQVEPGKNIDKIELSGSAIGIFITQVIAYDATGANLVFESNNVVVKKINYDIFERINCEKEEKFHLIFNDYIMNALKEAEDVAKVGSLSKAKSKGLVEQAEEGQYRLKKTGYPFFDYNYEKTDKIVVIKNDASQPVIVILNKDKKLIIGQGKQGGLSIPQNFTLSSVKINNHSLISTSISEMQNKIAATVPHHMCGMLTIDDDLLEQIGVPAIGHYVTFRNKSRTSLTMVINDDKALYLDVSAMKRQATVKNLEDIRQSYKKPHDSKQEAASSCSSGTPASPRGEGTLSPRRERTRERRGSNELFELRDRPVRTIDLELYNNRYIQTLVINGQRFEQNTPLVAELNERIKRDGQEIVIDDAFLEEYGVKLPKK